MPEENKTEQDALSPTVRAALGLGAAGGGSALLAASRDPLTGRQRLYHGTAAKNIDKIKQEGLLPHARVGGPAITDVLADDIREKAKNQVYLTPRSMEARGYAGQAEFLARGGNKKDIFGRTLDTLKAQLNPFTPKVTVEVPYLDKELRSRFTVNPEARGSLEEFNKHNPMIAAFDPGGKTYEALKNAITVDGAVDPQYIRGSEKFKGLTLDELKQYVKAKPGRAALGGLMALSGVTALGLGAHQVYKGLRDRSSEKSNEGEVKMSMYSKLMKMAETGVSFIDVTNPEEVPLTPVLPFGSTYVGYQRGNAAHKGFTGAARGVLGGVGGSVLGQVPGLISGVKPLQYAGHEIGNILGTHYATKGLLEPEAKTASLRAISSRL